MPTRRSLLRTGGLVGVGTIAAIAALPAPPDGTARDRTVEGAEPPAAVAEWTERRLADEDDSPIARYQYAATDGDVDRTDHDAFRATAPVNVVLLPAAETDAAGLERVMDVLTDEGWYRRPEEYTRYAWDRASETYVRQMATAAETYYGTSGRLHVRCWSFEGVVSVQAHEDTGARPRHGIASYERGREAVAAIFDAAGWTVSPTAIDLENEQSDHDGDATVVAEVES